MMMEETAPSSTGNGGTSRRKSSLTTSRRMSAMKIEQLAELERDGSAELEYIKDAFASASKSGYLNSSGRSSIDHPPQQQQQPQSYSHSRPIAMSMQSMDSIAGDESTVHDGSGDGQQQHFGMELAGKETQAVYTLKIILCLVLMLSTVIVATFVFLYTSNDEKDEFQESFLEFSNLLQDNIQKGAQNRLEAIAALANQCQAYALTSSNNSWPFVTIPYFEEQVNVMQSLTAAYGVLLFPVVLDSQREEWEDYSVNNVGWINASFDAQRSIYGTADQPLPNTDEGETWFDVLWGEDYVNPNNPDFSNSIGSKIFRTSDPNDPDFRDPYIHETTSVYFPQWQVAPMSWYYQTTVNSNYGQWDDFYNSTVISIQTKTAVLGIAWTDGNAPGRITTMLYPIFDKFHETNNNENGDPQKRKVVAFLGADIFWQDYLKDILPENANGIYVVIENTIGQVFTYQLFGEVVEYVGYDDFHEEEFDDMVQSIVFGEHLHPPLPNDATYTGAPLHGGFIQYTMKIYPSQQLEESYISNKPISYTILAVLIFLFTSLVFIMYDCLVERRQRLVLETAIQSDAIVSSLFPTTVKDRLYNAKSQHNLKASGNNNNNGAGGTNDGGNTAAMEDGDKRLEVGDEYDMPVKDDSGGFSGSGGGGGTAAGGGVKRLPSTKLGTPETEPPIAELYETSTILFADIVGFTAWSSDRPPADVFTLLETIYGRFDKIAKRRNVFKVETIGDCYVAVAGVPERRFDHAINMTKFARDMLVTLREELENLEPILGSDTLNLAMRVGLHSGPVTAGVLRGERARFQLFGDSVNTAARMESNSSRNAIHVSQATATLLESAGKKYWLVKRKEKIVAKGKGEMQTYWVRGLSSRGESSVVQPLNLEETETSET